MYDEESIARVPARIVQELNCVSRVAAMENARQTQLLVKAIADGIRYRARRHQSVVSLGTALEVVRQTLGLYKLRFGDRFSFAVDAGESTSDVLVPHCCIPPFVDNALDHAFTESDGDRRVTVAGASAGSFFIVEIVDNGVGFDAAPYLAGGANPTGEEAYGSIAATAERIRAARSSSPDRPDHGWVTIESGPGTGTRVRVAVPL